MWSTGSLGFDQSNLFFYWIMSRRGLLQLGRSLRGVGSVLSEGSELHSASSGLKTVQNVGDIVRGVVKPGGSRIPATRNVAQAALKEKALPRVRTDEFGAVSVIGEQDEEVRIELPAGFGAIPLHPPQTSFLSPPSSISCPL